MHYVVHFSMCDCCRREDSRISLYDAAEDSRMSLHHAVYCVCCHPQLFPERLVNDRKKCFSVRLSLTLKPYSPLEISTLFQILSVCT